MTDLNPLVSDLLLFVPKSTYFSTNLREKFRKNIFFVFCFLLFDSALRPLVSRGLCLDFWWFKGFERVCIEGSRLEVSRVFWVFFVEGLGMCESGQKECLNCRDLGSFVGVKSPGSFLGSIRRGSKVGEISRTLLYFEAGSL